MSAPSVVLARSLYLGTNGIDVVAVKRALSRAGYMQWGTFTETWGENARNANHAFQKAHHIPLAGYGPITHHTLLNTRRKGSKTEWAWDSLSLNLMQEEYTKIHVSPEDRIRTQGMQMCHYLYEHSIGIGYSNHRPSWLGHLGSTPPSYMDCSGLASVAHYAAGAKNPNIEEGIRLPWNGEGYTGTLLAGGRKVPSVHYLKPLDLIFYGFTTNPGPAFPYGSPTHVAVYDGAGMVFSMGHYPMGHYVWNYGQSINCYVTYNVVP